MRESRGTSAHVIDLPLSVWERSVNICELGGVVFICRQHTAFGGVALITFYNPQMMHVSLIGDFKLAAGVDVSYCLSLCVSL